MAKPKRGVRVDKKTYERLQAMNNKEAKIDAANDMPIPDDGLNHARWPAEARKLALLLADPAWLGRSQEELGGECGYSLRSVNRYLNDPEFVKYAQKVAERVYTDELYPLFVAAMRRGLIRGDAKFCELYGKSRGMFKEVRQVTSDVNITDNTKKDDDIDAELERLAKETKIDGKVVN